MKQTYYQDYVVEPKLLFERQNRAAVGSPAPSLRLEDINGNQVSLTDFWGKVVYVDFWATWCQPCLSKISMTNTLQSRMLNNDVVFVHVSLEKTRRQWRDAVRFRNYSGVHLYAEGGINSEIAKAFNVTSMPTYFIIDRYGNFAPKPVKSDMFSLQNCLVELTN